MGNPVWDVSPPHVDVEDSEEEDELDEEEVSSVNGGG
jgi:hypothetical protein